MLFFIFVYHLLPIIISTLDKLLFWVFTQLKFQKKQFKFNLWGKYPIISKFCSHLYNRVPKRKILISNSIRNMWVKRDQNTQTLSKALPVETVCMICKILFFVKNEKNINNLVSAELAMRALKVNSYWFYNAQRVIIYFSCFGVFFF